MKSEPKSLKTNLSTQNSKLRTLNLKKLVFFDGVCNLCNGFVQFVIRRDKSKKFLFAPLQSDAAKELLKEIEITRGRDSKKERIREDEIDISTSQSLGISKSRNLQISQALNLETVLYYRDGEVLMKSDAALAVFRELGGIWRLIAYSRILPRGFRDFIYDIIARNRYGWFGKRDVCMVPEAGVRERFLL